MASPAPIISYKKKRAGLPQSATSSPRPDDSGHPSPLPSSAPGTPLAGTRKVSSRRKALQDFYKLKAAEGDSVTSSKEQLSGLGIESPATPANEPQQPEDDSALIAKLGNKDELEAFIKNSTIEEILRIRNAAANKINHHDSEKKSIIYNNYSELIRLNQVLDEVNAAKKTEFYGDEQNDTNSSPQDIEACLNNLTSFIDTEAALFNNDFTSVVKDLCDNMSGSESLASVRGINSV